ncbi:MAG: hypothetical protein ABL908_14395 [Hyphomicrobium sp.]
MIAHVAEAGEDRGRVVLRLDPASRPNRIALEAAVRVAQAFQSEIESLVVADEQLFELAAFSFACEVSRSGRVQPLSADNLHRDIGIAAGALGRAVREVAAKAGVRVHERVVRDEPVRAVARTCAELGPWNVVALAESFTAHHAAIIRQLFDAVLGATGIVVTGPRAVRLTGPILVAIEEIDRLPPMLRAAERLAAVTRAEVKLLIVSDDPRELQWMEDQARLVLGGASRVRLEPSRPARDAAEVAERLRRLGGGFLIAQYGGVVVPDAGDLKPLAFAMECPLLLVR